MATFREKVIREGTFVYDRTVVCSIRILQSDGRQGNGDPNDKPEYREDCEGTFYRYEYDSAGQRGAFGNSSFLSEDLNDMLDYLQKNFQDLQWMS